MDDLTVRCDPAPRPRHRPMVLGVVALLVIGCGAPAVTSSVAPASGSVATLVPPSGSPDEAPPPTEPPSASPNAAGWVVAAPMHKARQGFDAVLLGDGTVLAVGDDFACTPGGAVAGSETAELYDPIGDAWAEDPPLNNPRKTPATVALREGSAMVIGGINKADFPFSSTKVFAPTTRTWADGPLLRVARGSPYATVLADGRVLVVSEGGSEGGRTTSEVYDPISRIWSPAGSWPEDTSISGLISLRDGRALGIGIDFNPNDTEPSPVAFTFDPSSGAWTRVDSPPDSAGGDLVALADGGALSIGGSLLLGFDEDVDAGRRATRFDPASARWMAVAPMTTTRFDPLVAVLADGRVLVGGGASGFDGPDAVVLRSSEIYDPSADRWTPGPDLLEPRKDGLTVVLQDGSVLVLGGDAQFNTEFDTPFCAAPLQTVERFHPGS